MERRNGGGRFLEGKLQELDRALEDYYGAINMLKEGLTTSVPDKPEALKVLEQCESLDIPLVAGGLMDQPHIWLLEVGRVKKFRDTFELLDIRDDSGGQHARNS